MYCITCIVTSVLKTYTRASLQIPIACNSIYRNWFAKIFFYECRFWYQIGFVIGLHITTYIYEVRKDMIPLLEGKIRKLIRKWFWFFGILINLFIWINMHDWTKLSILSDVLRRWNDIQWHSSFPYSYLFPHPFIFALYIEYSIVNSNFFQNSWVSFQDCFAKMLYLNNLLRYIDWWR